MAQSPQLRPKGPPDEVKRELDLIRKASGRLGRIEATLHLAGSIPLAKITAWLDFQWFDLREGCETKIFDTILRDRLIEGDLEAYLSWSARSGRSDVKDLLKVWAASEPRKLLDYFRAHPDPVLEVDLLIVMGKKFPQLTLQRLSEMLAGGNAEETNLYGLVEVLAASDPAGLAALEPLMSPERRHWTEIRIASEQLKKTFGRDFPALLNNPDGIAIYRNAMHQIPGSGNSLLDRLATLPPEWITFMEQNPYEFATTAGLERVLRTDLEQAGVTAEGAQTMRECALQEISRTDPEKALRLLDQFGFDPQRRRDLLQGIVVGHNTEVARVQALIASMASAEDRQMAESFLHPQPGSDPRRQRTPQEWIQKASAPGLSTLSYQARETLAGWSRDEIAALGASFGQLPDDGKARAARLIVKECSKDDNDFQALKGQAVAYLLTRTDLRPDPFDQMATPGIRVSRQVQEWAVTDATAAGDWVKTLPGAEERTAGEIALASVWMDDDPDEARRWISSLPPGDRDKVAAALKTR